MSAESPSSTAPSLRRLPYTIRLSPPVVNRLLSHTQQADTLHNNIHGLLFGLSEEGLLVVQAFRSFGENSGNINGEADRARQDELFEQLLTIARKDPEISSLELVGWYTVRTTGSLIQSDIQFHDRYFKRPGDLALVLKPEGNTDVLWELYCRSVNGVFSDEAYRWGTVRLPYGSSLVSPIEIAMRVKIQDDFFMRAYEAISLEEEGNQDLRWKRVVRNTAQKALGLFSGQRQKAPFTPGTGSRGEKAVPAVACKQSNSSAHQERANAHVESFQKVYAGPSPSVPALISEASAKRSSAPWISSAAIFAVAASLTFSLIYNGGLLPEDNLPPFLKAFFPTPKLELRLESQGDRILLSWNRRHPAIRNSKGGILQVDDGAQHRRFSLDAAQISNGSVLYRPNSDDVTFRLEAEGAQGGKVSETIRVLEAAKPGVLDLSTPASDSSASHALAPQNRQAAKSTVQ